MRDIEGQMQLKFEADGARGNSPGQIVHAEDGTGKVL